MAKEIEKVFQHILKKEHFLLSGGAGSGKTYSLVQVLSAIFQGNPTSKVACITYTNVAVAEIKDRVKFENLRVSTIHDFLWDNIKAFQKNIKEAIVALIQSGKLTDNTDVVISNGYYWDKSIDYKDWKKLTEGIVSHDEIPVIAEYLFENYPILSDILIDKFDYILIDEYQDTSVEVVRILLEHVQRSKKRNVIGFFGDSMQSIYDDTVGNLNTYVSSGVINEVLKEDNRRNPSLVIELANKLRTDTVKQKPAEDPSAINYGKQGTIKFLYSSLTDVSAIKSSAHFIGWDFTDAKETKELYLTHNLIAPKAGFPELMSIYDKDRIIEFKNEVVKAIKEKNVVVPDDATFGDAIRLSGIEPGGVKATFIAANKDLFVEAQKYSFEQFRRIYLDKDLLIGSKKGTDEEERKKGSKRDTLIKHLFHIQECLFLYDTGRYNEFIRQSGFVIRSVEDKVKLKAAIEELKSMQDSTIEEVIELAHKSNVWPKDEKFNEFVINRKYLYDRVKLVKYREFCNLYNYIEGYTPFSTQHNIKGTQFNNVFVVLDNGEWNKYNFKNLFLQTGSPSVLERTQKLFYVCCTRTKENLVVFYHNPPNDVLEKAKGLFGTTNVIKV